MALYKVKKDYNDKKLNRLLTVGDEVEMSIKRANEVEHTLKENGFNGPFLERLEEKK